MGFYADRVLPHLVDRVCGIERIRRQREKVVPLAAGRVLEVGLGSGHNLEFYDPARVTRVWGLEPSERMRALARAAVERLPFDFEFIDAPGEDVPLEAGSVDTVVVTYTLCTVPDVEAVVGEISRVLVPGGQLLFCEHGVAPDPRVRRWQAWLNPLWRPLAGGCNLNRDPRGVIAAGGFRFTSIESGYVPGWRPAGYHYWGRAVPAG
ncbi:MAG TPA: class I SAM-dependent methyltransferase [Vicinamibacterales bacterium]|nr:class I SAM-dependent methyltransferase [Vicinamibacterales bacterium]